MNDENENVVSHHTEQSEMTCKLTSSSAEQENTDLNALESTRAGFSSNLQYLDQVDGPPGPFSLAPGERQSFTFQYVITQDDVTEGTQIVNEVEVCGQAYDDGDIKVCDRDVETVERLSVDLSVEKYADTPYPMLGYPVTFYLKIYNAGPANSTNILVEDILPVRYQYVPGSIGPIGDPNVTADESDAVNSKLSWQIDYLAAGQHLSPELTFQAVPLPPPNPLEPNLEQNFTNFSEVSTTSQFDRNVYNNIHTLFVPPILPPVVELKITKTAETVLDEDHDGPVLGYEGDPLCTSVEDHGQIRMKSSGRNPPLPGDRVSFCLSVSNCGVDAATGRGRRRSTPSWLFLRSWDNQWSSRSDKGRFRSSGGIEVGYSTFDAGRSGFGFEVRGVRQ